MSMIHEVYLAVKGGAELENVIPSGADITLWQHLLNNYDPNRKPRARRSHTDNGRGKRSSKARMESAIGWATLELVERVNGWKRGHTPSAAEEYGLEPPL